MAGQMPKDKNHASVPNGLFQTQDNTGTPITSPVTVTNAVKTIAVPLNAISCVILATTNLVRVSEDSTLSTYFTTPSGVPVEFPCANQANIYLFRDGASDATVHFFFKTLNT